MVQPQDYVSGWTTTLLKLDVSETVNHSIFCRMDCIEKIWRDYGGCSHIYGPYVGLGKIMGISRGTWKNSGPSGEVRVVSLREASPSSTVMSVQKHLSHLFSTIV